MPIIIERNLKLFRNLKGVPFVTTQTPEQLESNVQILEPHLKELGYEDSKMEQKNSLEKLKLLEEEEISFDFLKNSYRCRFVKEGSPSILINSTNHITFMERSKDLDFTHSYERISELERLLEQRVEFAFDLKLGYLTTRPINCGTGLCPMVKFHLPALAYNGLEKVKNSLLRLGYNLYSFSEKGSKAVGDIYCLTFESTIGDTEENFIAKINTITREIVAMEQESRKNLYLDNIITLEDMVNRSLGVLKNARILSEEEMMESMSRIQLGIDLSVLKTQKQFDFYREMIHLKNGHLQQKRGSILDKRSRDILRANESRILMKEVF